MSWIWPILTILIIAAWVFAVVDIIRRRHTMSGGKIAAWIIVIIVFPILGAIVYYVVNGMGGGASEAPRGQEMGGRPL
jgi:phospholipase D-like protein